MSADLGFGSVREVWYAPLDDPVDGKKSFLIRDDAFSKSGAIFGRTVRLGEPLNTGPGSGWRQTTWEGGQLRHDWQDEAMYFEGNLDTWSHTGRIRMWPGFAHIHKDATRKFDSYVFGNGNDGPAIGNTKLYFGERNYFYVAGPPSGGFKAYRYDPDANTLTTLPTTPNTLANTGYTAIVPAQDDGSSSSFIYFGTPGGWWVYQESGNSFAKDTGASYPVNHDAAVTFRDALYYCSGKALVKRTPSAAFGIVGTHTIIKSHNAAYATQGLTVWNNRLWYGINFQGNRCMLGTSDGVSAQSIIEFPEEFQALSMKAHYGALFIFGHKPQAVAGSGAHPNAVAQVWKYTGSSLTKLWESNDEDQRALTDNRPHIISGSTATFGSLLVWGNPGYPGTVTPRPSIWAWDAEVDAIIEGPSLVMDPANREGLVIANVHGWDNTLVVTYRDNHNYVSQGATGVDWPQGVAYLRWPNKMRNKSMRLANTFKGRSVDWSEPERKQFLVSSRYRGDASVATETKTWLSGKVNVRLAAPGAYMNVYVVLDDNKSYLVKRIDFDPDNRGWRTVQFPVKNPGSYTIFPEAGAADALSLHAAIILGDGSTPSYVPSTTVATVVPDADNTDKYLQSQFVQYRFEMVNNDAGNADSIATPELDSWELQWTVAPKKRMQYHLRHVLTDGQERLDGNANPVTTAQEMADALEELWGNSLPFLMWGPFAEPRDPDPDVDLNNANAIEVVPVVESFQVNQYRIDTEGSDVGQEVAWTLIENVTS